MPNFWSRGIQYLEEKLGATTTDDKDFENLLQRIEITEKGLASLRTVLQNFNSYIENFCSFFTDLNGALRLIYEETPYYMFIEEFICKQQIINTHFEDLSKLLVKLYSKSSEWDKIFDSARSKLVEREEKRKVYDHYEKKLMKIHKTSKDQKYIDRNEEKYTKAASEYVGISEKIYHLLDDSLKLSWELVNPVVSDLILGEKKLFEGISSTLSCFQDNFKRFSEIKYSINNPNSNRKSFIYDPLKYMKEKDLIKTISVKRTMNSIYIPNKNKNEDNQRKYSIFSWAGNNDTKQIEDTKVINNFDNVLSHSRLTNTFGNMPKDKLEEFYNIEDDFH